MHRPLPLRPQSSHKLPPRAKLHTQAVGADLALLAQAAAALQTPCTRFRCRRRLSRARGRREQNAIHKSPSSSSLFFLCLVSVLLFYLYAESAVAIYYFVCRCFWLRPVEDSARPRLCAATAHVAGRAGRVFAPSLSPLPRRITTSHQYPQYRYHHGRHRYSFSCCQLCLGGKVGLETGRRGRHRHLHVAYRHH